MTCAKCKHFHESKEQPEGIPTGIVAGMCVCHPPTVVLRPQAIGPGLLDGTGKPQVILVPVGYYPPVVTVTPACGEYKVVIRKKK